MPSYTDFLSKLNPNQRAAVTTIDGPVLVVAGPGTGKTQVLVGRIAQILKETDTRPESILALTFTESAAKNMRSRLVSLIGSVGYAGRIATFHAFCVEVINTHPEYFLLTSRSETLTELERYDLLQQGIRELPLKRLRPVGDPYLYLRDCIHAISDLKREGMSVAQFQTLATQKLAEARELWQEWSTLTSSGTKRVKGAPTRKLVFDQLKNAEKWSELSLLYADFQSRLHQAERFDFDDMITMVVDAFSQHEELLIEYQENLHYFLVDEYQDTNSSQDMLLDLLTAYWGEQANIFAVGDPNQAIFRFQGASVENMLGFVKRYPTTAVINLNQGYRCPQSLYDAATHLISRNQVWLHTEKIPYSTQLFSLNHATPPIQLLEAPTQQLEAIYVAQQIERLCQSGVKPEQIAVLYRTNSERVVVAEAMRKWQLPYVVEGGFNILANEQIQQLLDICRAVVAIRTANHDSEVYRSLYVPWLKLDVLTLMQLSRLSDSKRLSVGTLLQKTVAEIMQLAEEWKLDESAVATILQTYQKLSYWSGLDYSLSLPAWFETVIAESGYIQWVQNQPNLADGIVATNTLFTHIKQLVVANHELRLADFMRVLNTFELHQLALIADEPNVQKGAITLSTVHKAKGREWEYVFVIGVSDEKWGNSKDRSKLRLPAEVLTHTRPDAKDRNEDDRRLFYVAITRAKTNLWVTWPTAIQKVGRAEQKVVSQFVAELGDNTVNMSIDEQQSSTADLLVRLLSPVEQVASPQYILDRRKEFFSLLVEKHVWSATSLNAYLRDPQEFVLQHLIRIPRAKPEPMVFGTAIHAALEHHVRETMQTGKQPKIDETIQVFETALRHEILLPDALERRLDQGREILRAYLTTMQLQPAHIVLVERMFGKGARGLVYNKVPISGRIDRIDLIDQSKKHVMVIDYKTGKPRTDGQICGTTKDAAMSEREMSLPVEIRGAYKRQLLFYKLLADQDTTFGYHVTHGRFDFVEADKQSDKHIIRTFELPKDEVSMLGELLVKVAAEVKALTFLDSIPF